MLSTWTLTRTRLQLQPVGDLLSSETSASRGFKYAARLAGSHPSADTTYARRRIRRSQPVASTSLAADGSRNAPELEREPSEGPSASKSQPAPATSSRGEHLTPPGTSRLSSSVRATPPPAVRSGCSLWAASGEMDVVAGKNSFAALIDNANTFGDPPVVGSLGIRVESCDLDFGVDSVPNKDGFGEAQALVSVCEGVRIDLAGC